MSLYFPTPLTKNGVYQCFICVPTHQLDYLTVVLICIASIISDVIFLSFIYIPLRPIYSPFMNSSHSALTSLYSYEFFLCLSHFSLFWSAWWHNSSIAILYSLVNNRYLIRSSEIVDRLFFFLLAYHPLLPSLFNKITRLLRTRTYSHTLSYPDYHTKYHFYISKYLSVNSYEFK